MATVQELLSRPPEERCRDCQLYPPDGDGRCSGCIRYEKRTGQRREPWVASNPVQGRWEIGQPDMRLVLEGHSDLAELPGMPAAALPPVLEEAPATALLADHQGPQGGDSGMTTRELVHIDGIDDNPWQPRQAIDPDEVRNLADSIDKHRLRQVPLGRTLRGRVQLAFGHRRVSAWRLLHQEGKVEPFIPMDLDDLSDEEMAVLVLTENEQRQQLTQVEVVRAHKRVIEETSLTIQALADQVGMSRSALSNNLRVLELPDFVLEHVESGALGLTVAREFLALRHNGHARVEDMERVIDYITSTWGRQGAPDWSRRHVRQQIYQRVAHNETDWRPLGPKPRYAEGGATREATFDVEMFAAEHQETLHTIPADDAANERYNASRLWTCNVKEWRTWQTRATREATKEADAKGVSGETPAKSPSREQQLAELLGQDPVWKKITVSRETPGPNRPVTDGEREQLGTRQQLREVAYDTPFWKILQKAPPGDGGESLREKGGAVPSWFPDLKECQNCTIGAAYGKSRDGYPPGRPTLVCLNWEHYLEKLAAGEAKRREKLAAHRKGMGRQDQKLVGRLMAEIQLLSEDARQALAHSLVAATHVLDWRQPLGRYHEAWSYEPWVVTSIRSLLDLGEPYRGSVQCADAVEDLPDLAQEDLQVLVAALMTYHLHLAGKTDEVLGTTAGQAEPDPEPVSL